MKDMAEPSETRKERLVEELSTQYSHGTISLEEYERLIDYSNKIETDKELVIFERIIKETSSAGEYEDEPDYAYEPRYGRSDITILSSRRTPGSAAKNAGRIITILGDNHLMFEDGDLRKAETTIEVLVLLGDVVIHVPEDVAVIINAIPILGGTFGGQRKRKKSVAATKKLIVNGQVILGNVTVKVGR